MNPTGKRRGTIDAIRQSALSVVNRFVSAISSPFINSNADVTAKNDFDTDQSDATSDIQVCLSCCLDQDYCNRQGCGGAERKDFSDNFIV